MRSGWRRCRRCCWRCWRRRAAQPMHAPAAVAAARAHAARRRDSPRAAPAAAPAAAAAPCPRPRPRAAAAAQPPAAAAPAAAASADSGTRSLDEQIQDLKKQTVRAEPRSVRARGGAAVPGQHPGGGVRVGGCRGFLRARFDQPEDRQPRGQQLSVHAARGGGAAQGRRAAAVRGQPQVRAARAGGVLQRQGAERALLPARGAASGSRRASAPSTWSSRSPIMQRAQQPDFEIKDWE